MSWEWRASELGSLCAIHRCLSSLLVVNEQEGQTRYWEAANVLALKWSRIPYWHLDTPWVSKRWRVICLVGIAQLLNGQCNAFLTNLLKAYCIPLKHTYT